MQTVPPSPPPALLPPADAPPVKGVRRVGPRHGAGDEGFRGRGLGEIGGLIVAIAIVLLTAPPRLSSQP